MPTLQPQRTPCAWPTNPAMLCHTQCAPLIWPSGTPLYRQSLEEDLFDHRAMPLPTMLLEHSISTDTSTELSSVSSWDVSPEPSGQEKRAKTRTLAPNLTRRSHKKSRAGCYMCKSRKIKCGEQKPACGNCLLKGMPCVYPVQQPLRRSNLPLIRRSPSDLLPSGTAAFSMVDMRFFHHFLTVAYPHLPVGNDDVWVHEVPQFAGQHEYLMHAILSLGASHLSRLTGVDYRKESLIHRGHAIAGLNQALSKTGHAYGESDAMLASCYALTFQASYMSDGLTDFITMVRGCALTTAKIRDDNAPTAFNVQPDFHFKFMAPRLHNLPPVDSGVLEDGFHALDSIRPVISGETELDFYSVLLDVILSLQSSPSSGYVRFTNVYGVWYELGPDAFKTFLDPNNLAALLLLAYFIAIQLLMIPLAAHEWPNRADVGRVRVLYGIIEWAKGIFERLEASSLRHLLDWPKTIVSAAVAEINGDLPPGPPVLQLHLALDKDTPSGASLSPSG